ncbi:hypothetical protein BaRGS_00038985 [Batillaria attramentaria]|uniref:GST N-terminal domain-containing protein n=1 Tax=Batillaria attramentaria TaxID=370345 RepID=A0ABD0J495_9CAEN
MAASPSIKLYYLHLTCRAEVCRLLLAASGVEWEDVRFPYADWPKFKPEIRLRSMLTMADFAMYVAVVHTVKGECGVSEADREFPMIRALCSKVEADPNVRKYMDKHKPVIYGGITELIRM